MNKKNMVGSLLLGGLLFYLVSDRKKDGQELKSSGDSGEISTENLQEHHLSVDERIGSNSSTNSLDSEPIAAQPTESKPRNSSGTLFPEYVMNFYGRIFNFEDSSERPPLTTSSIFSAESSDIPSELSGWSGIYFGKLAFPTLNIEAVQFEVALKVKSKSESNLMSARQGYVGDDEENQSQLAPSKAEYEVESDIAIFDSSSKVWHRVVSKEIGGTPSHMATRLDLAGNVSMFIPQMILPGRVQSALRDEEQNQAPPEYSSIRLVGMLQKGATGERKIFGNANGHRAHLKDPVGKFELEKQD